ncbi:MAG: hypothetical protein ABI442_07875 [Gemmatimonadaceae bacterium]
MKQFSLAITFGLILGAAVPAFGQQLQTQKDSARKAAAIPADARPPKGMCRIWIDNVPAAQQPAATDCPTAVRNRPANARVIFGDEYSDTNKTKTSDKDKSRLPPGVKGFTDLRPSSVVLPKRPPVD